MMTRHDGHNNCRSSANDTAALQRAPRAETAAVPAFRDLQIRSAALHFFQTRWFHR